MLATDASGNVYAADLQLNTIQKFTSSGTYITQWGSPGTGPGQFAQPIGIATDASGNVYVADAGNNRVQKFGPGTTAASSPTWGRLKSLYRR